VFLLGVLGCLPQHVVLALGVDFVAAVETQFSAP
jgi:hypothetical protein